MNMSEIHQKKSTETENFRKKQCKDIYTYLYIFKIQKNKMKILEKKLYKKIQ